MENMAGRVYVNQVLYEELKQLHLDFRVAKRALDGISGSVKGWAWCAMLHGLHTEITSYAESLAIIHDTDKALGLPGGPGPGISLWSAFLAGRISAANE